MVLSFLAGRRSGQDNKRAVSSYFVCCCWKVKPPGWMRQIAFHLSLCFSRGSRDNEVSEMTQHGFLCLSPFSLFPSTSCHPLPSLSLFLSLSPSLSCPFFSFNLSENHSFWTLKGLDWLNSFLNGKKKKKKNQGTWKWALMGGQQDHLQLISFSTNLHHAICIPV